MLRARSSRVAVLGATALLAASLTLVMTAGPATSAPQDDTKPPPTPSAPSSDVSALTTVSASDEASYRQALTDLSADGSGPHTLEITADFSLDDGTDPLYNGAEDLTINGNGHTIDAQETSRILSFETPASLTVNDLTGRNGLTPNDGGAMTVGGPATINRSTFIGNVAASDGGAFDFSPPNATDEVVVNDSTFIDNRTTGTSAGGAIDITNAPDLRVTGSTFSGNDAGGNGGALQSQGDLVVVNSTFFDNNADVAGGAIDIASSPEDELSLTYVTLASNSSPLGANLRVEGVIDSVTLYGTVLSDPQVGENCSLDPGAALVSAGFNYSTDASCGLTGTGDVEDGADPQLGALGDNGGPTPTMLPAATSPLVDAIPVAECAPGIETDQRGVTRPGFDGCDIGAVELQPEPEPQPEPIVLTPTFTG